MCLQELEGQGWDVRLCDGGMALQNRDGDLFANVAKVNVYPVGLNVVPLRTALAACTMGGDDAEPTHDELANRLDGVVMVATAKGVDGIKATLLTWHRLGHPSLKMWLRAAQTVW